MIESVAQRGYRSTTVAHVIALAGVSRRAFYEQFGSKEECFLVTYDIIVARARKRILDGWKGELGWANRMEAACRALLEDAAQSPKGARLVLVDSFGVGPKGRERLELVGFTFERLLTLGIRGATREGGLHPLTRRAIIGGFRHLMLTRLLQGREYELARADEIMEWIESYRTPPGASLLTETYRQPRATTGRSEFLESDAPRARLLGSVLHMTLDTGYAKITDSELARFAGVSTDAFYREFANKEDCFFAVLDEMTQEALTITEMGIEDAASWPEAVVMAMEVFLEYLVAHPALSRIAFVDIFDVGPAITSNIMRPIERLITLLTDIGPSPQRAPDLARDAAVGAVWNIITSYVMHDRFAKLADLPDVLAFVVLGPYVGPKTAVETLYTAQCRRLETAGQ